MSLDPHRGEIQQLIAAPGVDASSIAGIGVSGQQHGLVCLKQDGELARPMAKLWNGRIAG